MNDLRPWLIEKLGDPKCSSAERSGAANGLTEVLVAAGSDITEEAVLNDIIPLQHFPEASKREGVLWMLSYLAPALGQGFSFEWGFVPALINGLADDSDTVREVAMRAGKVLIRTHGKLHHDKILPSVSLSSNVCCARIPEQKASLATQPRVDDREVANSMSPVHIEAFAKGKRHFHPGHHLF